MKILLALMVVLLPLVACTNVPPKPVLVIPSVQVAEPVSQPVETPPASQPATSQPVEATSQPIADRETPLEEAILDRAMQCKGALVGKFDRALLRDMLRAEAEYQVPDRVRGIVLVAACRESRYDPLAEGDFRHGVPMAIGIMQLWPWWEKSSWGPRVDRRNPRAAARAWIGHVAKQVRDVKRQCGFNSQQVDDLWRTAWITAVRAPSKTPRCAQQTGQWKLFTEWRDSWAPTPRESCDASPCQHKTETL